MKLRRLLYLTKHALFRKTKPSLDGIDDKLRKYLDFKNGFFIEAGANDGYSRSNTYYLEKKLGWTGLLVEGIPELYVKCVKRRPNSVVIGCALVKDRPR